MGPERYHFVFLFFGITKALLTILIVLEECSGFHFSECLVQVLFTGEKIGVGLGKTRKDAQQQAAENALHNLAGKTSILFSIPLLGYLYFVPSFFLLVLHQMLTLFLKYVA